MSKKKKRSQKPLKPLTHKPFNLREIMNQLKVNEGTRKAVQEYQEKAQSDEA